MDWRLLTQIVILSVVVLAIVYDIIVYIRGGNRATISRTVYDASQRYPIIPLLVGVLLGHLFVPQHVLGN